MSRSIWSAVAFASLVSLPAAAGDGVLGQSRIRPTSGPVLGWDFTGDEKGFPRLRMQLDVNWSAAAAIKHLRWTDFGDVRPADGQWNKGKPETTSTGACIVYQEAGGKRTFSLRLSRLTPAMLVETDASAVTFFHGTQKTDTAEGLFNKNSATAAEVPMNPKYAAAFAGDSVVIGPAQDWRLPASRAYLTWLGQGSYFYTCQPHAALSYIPVHPPSASAKHFQKADAPFLFYFQNPPSAVEAAPGKGLTFTFAGPAGRIAFLPLLGFRTPAAADTEKWGQEKALPEPVQESARWWSRHLQEYPAGVSETYTCNADRGEVTISERFQYLPVAAAPDPAARIAPLPPYLGIAVQFGYPLDLSARAIASGTVTNLGPLLAVEGTDTYVVTVKNLNKYLMRTDWLRAGAALRSPYAARLLRPQIDRILQAGHLAPWLEFAGKSSYANWTYPDFSNPGETIWTLVFCLPWLDQPTADRLKGYLKQEYLAYPPLSMAVMPYDQGARREYYQNYPKSLTPNVQQRGFYRFHRVIPVENLYAAALYHSLIADPKALAEDRPRAEAVFASHNAEQDWAVMKPLGRYMYWPDSLSGSGGVMDTQHFFAGVIGYIRLAELAGDAEARQRGLYLLARTLVARYAEGKYTQFLYQADIARPPETPDWPMQVLRDARKCRHHVLWTHHWSKPIDDIRQVYTLGQAGPTIAEVNGYQQVVVFALTGLVPEMGIFLKDHLRPESQRTVERIAENSPIWYMAWKPASLGAEVFTDMPQVAVGTMQARAWVLDESAQSLAKYLDVPWLPLGDYFYLQKLTACLMGKGQDR